MREPPSALGRRGWLKATAILLIRDNPQKHLPETLHRLGAGPAICIGNAGALRRRQLALELSSLHRQFQQPLPSITPARMLVDEPLSHQLAKNAIQALFGDAEDRKQLADRHLRMASDKVDYAVMGAPEIVARENRIGLRGKIAIGKEQQLDPLPHLILVGKGRDSKRFYVRHIDLSRNLGYRRLFYAM
jgi:hypothetical protein